MDGNMDNKRYRYELSEGLDRSKHYQLIFDDTLIGIAKVVDNGYLVPGRRKPAATLKEAFKQVIDDRIKQSLNEHKKWLNIKEILALD